VGPFTTATSNSGTPDPAWVGSGTEAAVLRLPPQSVEAEQAVLGSILLDAHALNQVVERLKPPDFYRHAHQRIYDAALALFDKNEPVDILTVSEVLKDRGELQEAGGRTYINDLALAIVTTDHVAYYADLIRDKALLRTLIHAGTQVVSDAYEAEDAETAIDRAQQAIFQIAQQGLPDELQAIKDILPDAFARIEERHANRGSLMGVASGFYDLDQYTSGFQASDLVIVAARPSMGKTAFCLNIATHVALRENKPVLIFSLEMSKEQLVLRMLCSEAEIDAQRIRTGEVTEMDFHRISTAMGRLGDAPIYIDDTPGLTAMEIRAKARKVAMEHRASLRRQMEAQGETEADITQRLASQGELGLIVIDYLQLMEARLGTKSGVDNRVQEIAAISRGLKGIAREVNVPVIALSQLSRAVESRQDKKPMLSDLRESGSIEQDADLVMFIYRDEYYNKDTDRPGTADIIIAKQRNGPVGEVSLLFRNSITKFLNPADKKVSVF
jgi:replicative DNA helicase